ncbi:SREBP regulating gene protein isoform X1 [Cloeon dipterum]|uniref:SREBP regulating gene protein isoform X1 n=1 Tax=Cloeon dipterum TaxID=197152 RepID=UPI0032208E80
MDKLDMWKSYIVRFFRRKLVLGVIFGLSLTYCIFSFVSQGSSLVEDYDAVVKTRSQPFVWHSSGGEEVNSTSLKVTTCRNSVQGKVLIVDDRGYICLRENVLLSGCCDTNLETTKRYSCETCKENHCCSIYEHCISCCLHPDKKNVLQLVLGKASETMNVLFASVTDHFELCLAKCRTSSQSVQHENSYRDPRAKHCYGDMPPAAEPPGANAS